MRRTELRTARQKKKKEKTYDAGKSVVSNRWGWQACVLLMVLAGDIRLKVD